MNNIVILLLAERLKIIYDINLENLSRSEYIYV